MRRSRTIRRPDFLNWVQLIVVLFVFLLYVVLARALEAPPPGNVPLFVEQFIIAFPLFDVARPLLDFLFGFLRPSVLRHLLPLLLGVLVARRAVQAVVQALYVLDTPEEARVLLSRLSGGLVPFELKPLSLNRRNFEQMQREHELLRIGGPGFINISESDVVVTEINGRFVRTLGGGRQRLFRFERIVAVLDLRDQEDKLRNVPLLTSEGLELATDIRIVFRIMPESGRRSDNGYTHDPEAVRKLAYSQIVSDGTVARWNSVPVHIAAGQLRELLARKRLDDLLDPNSIYEVAPQPELQQTLHGRVNQSLQAMGIELITVSFSSLRLSDRMRETMLTYWEKFGNKGGMADPAPQGDSADRGKARAREHMINSLSGGVRAIRERSHAVERPPIKKEDSDLIESLLPLLQAYLARQSERQLPGSSDRPLIVDKTAGKPATRPLALRPSGTSPDEEPQLIVIREDQLRELLRQAALKGREESGK